MSEALIGTALMSVTMRKGDLAARFGEQLATVRAEADAAGMGITSGLDRALGAAKLAVLGVGAALIAGSVASGKMASDYQAATELLHTQAGMQQDDVDAVRGKLLQLAPVLGTAPTELANGFYHIASALTQLPPELRNVTSEVDVYTNAVKLSKIGNANLEDSTQAVVGALAAFGREGLTAKDAAAQLNAIVGSGDMRMQQLTAAMATGILPAASTFGLKLKDVGAALATLTDNVTPADEAATRLRMTFSLLGAPSGAAQKALGAIGINAMDLSYDMRKPDGLLLAISDLKSHLGHIDTSQIQGGIGTVKKDMEKFGFTTGQVDKIVKTLGPDATEQAFLISKAFGGGRSSSAVMTLLTEFDSFKDKYAAIDKQSKQFDENWSATTNNLNFKWQQVKAGAEAFGITVGNRLLPLAAQGLGQIAAWTPGIQTWAATFADKAVPAIYKLGDGLGQLLPAIGPVVAQFLMMVPPAISLGAQIASVLAPAFQFLGHHANIVVPVLMGIVGAMVALRVALAVTAAVQGFTIALRFATQIMAGAEAAENALSIAKATAAEKSLILTAVTIKDAAIRGIVRVATLAATAAQWLWNIAISANPIGLLIIAIALLVAGIILVVTHKKQAIAIAHMLWEKLKQLGSWIMTEGGRAWSWLASHIGGAFSAIGATLHSALGAIGAFFSGLGAAVHSGLSWLVATAEEAWRQFSSRPVYWIVRLILLVPGLLIQLIAAILRWGVQLAVAGAHAAQQFVTGHEHQLAQLPGKVWAWLLQTLARFGQWEIQTAQRAVSAGTQFLANVEAWLSAAPGKAWGWLVQTDQRFGQWEVQTAEHAIQAGQQFLSNVEQYLAQLPGRMQSWLSSAISAVESWASHLISNGEHAAQQFVDGIRDKVTGIDWGSLGSAIVRGIASGITGGVGSIISAAKDAAGQALQAAKDAIGAKSPSVRAALEIGQPFSEGVAVGIQQKAGLAQAQLSALLGGLVPSRTSVSAAGVAAAPDLSGAATAGGGATEATAATMAHLLTDIRDCLRQLEKITVPVNVYANTNADPWRIANEVAWAAKYR